MGAGPERGHASVTLLLGISGSGKSTYARRHFRPTQILSTDEIRASIADSPAVRDADDITNAVLFEILDERCRRGLRTVVDSTGLSADFRRLVRGIAVKRTVEVDLLAVEADLQTCLIRNRLRTPERRVPDEVIVQQHAAYVEAMSAVADEGYASVRVQRVDSEIVPATVFLSLPVSENFTSTGTFRPERQAFYESIISALRAVGAVVESAVLNEDWGAVKLETIEFTRYDLAAIDRSDALVVVTNTRLGSDIYLEIGYAAARSKPVLLVIPWATRLTYMLEGMTQMSALTVVRFDAENQVEQCILNEGKQWLAGVKGLRSDESALDRIGAESR